MLTGRRLAILELFANSSIFCTRFEGISAVVSATGELLATASVHERTALVTTVVPVRAATTLVLAWGDWFRPTALALVVILLTTLPRAPRPGPDARRRTPGKGA